MDQKAAGHKRVPSETGEAGHVPVPSGAGEGELKPVRPASGEVGHGPVPQATGGAGTGPVRAAAGEDGLQPVPRTTGEVDLGYARLDVDRAARTGDPEVVYGAGKTPAQIVGAMRALARAHPDRPVLATRLSAEAQQWCRRDLPGVTVDDVGRTATLGPPAPRNGRVAVVCAGTADLPVLRECAATVNVFGADTDEIVDVGVAGLHRLLAQRDRIAACDVVVAVAGMEAALPSVLGGLVGLPLIAVPTSIGYGWHLDGLTAWLATLNTCAPGVLSVNVDNGFGAGVAAARIARRAGAGR